MKAYELTDLFPNAEIDGDAAQRLVDPLARRRPIYIHEDQRTLYVHAANEGGFLFGLETGRFTYCENHAGQAPLPQQQCGRCLAFGRQDDRPLSA